QWSREEDGRPGGRGARAVAGSIVGAGLPAPRRAELLDLPGEQPVNQRVDTLPVASNSAAIIASIGLTTGLHPDFGSGLWHGSPTGTPITVVPGTQTKSKVAFQYASESDPGPYPIPSTVQIEGGSDRHAIIVDRDACKLYELYALQKSGRSWTAGSGAVWSL